MVMKNFPFYFLFCLIALFILNFTSLAQLTNFNSFVNRSINFQQNFKKQKTFEEKRKSISFEVLVSNNGIGLGSSYRLKYSPTLYGFTNFFVSEATDDREIVLTDYYGNTFYPGKVNRFLLLPLMVGCEYRIFSESIVDNFRPFINGAVGPMLIVSSPAQDEFFTSLKKAKAHFSFGGFVGIGTYWGINNETLFGISIKYLLASYPQGIVSLENPYTNQKLKLNEFGGFYITLNVGQSFD